MYFEGIYRIYQKGQSKYKDNQKGGLMEILIANCSVHTNWNACSEVYLKVAYSVCDYSK